MKTEKRTYKKDPDLEGKIVLIEYDNNLNKHHSSEEKDSTELYMGIMQEPTHLGCKLKDFFTANDICEGIVWTHELIDYTHIIYINPANIKKITPLDKDKKDDIYWLQIYEKYLNEEKSERKDKKNVKNTGRSELKKPAQTKPKQTEQDRYVLYPSSSLKNSYHI